MNKVQKKIYELLLELDRICKKHNIKYFLGSGTMLGAVRHKGFIPWDDDLDVEMLREDYEKFKEVCKTELNPKYFYQDTETDPYYGYIFAKLRINNTEFVEEIAANNKSHCGFYLDIFPIDSYKKKSTFAFKRVLFLRMLLLLRCNYTIKTEGFIKKAIVVLLKVIKTFTPRNFLIKRINSIIKKSSGDNKTKYVMSYAEIYFDKSRLLRKYYTKQKEYQFEGKKIPGTYYYDEYLTWMFGDYMTPPPKDKQRSHGIIKIKYEDE